MSIEEKINIDEQIKCAARELGLRYGVYPKLVARGQMSQEMADHEIRTMIGILDTLRTVKKNDGIIDHSRDV